MAYASVHLEIRIKVLVLNNNNNDMNTSYTKHNLFSRNDGRTATCFIYSPSNNISR